MSAQDPHRTNSHPMTVHVRENSDSDLEALFNVVNVPTTSNPTHVPFRDRNLPPSFFQEPKRHPNASDKLYTPSSGINPQLTIAHNRAHSSPATLQQSLSAAPPQPPQTQSNSPQHLRQHSCDALEQQPLPPGWEMAQTAQGQRYFMNHNSQTTTWIDPRKTISQLESNISLQNIQNLPFPPGWEQAVTQEGEVYYINHAEKQTSWYDPRIPQHLQRIQSSRLQGSPPGVQPGPPPQAFNQTGHSPSGSIGPVSPSGQSQQGQMAPGSGSTQQPQHMQQLHRLQVEKEKLRKKHEDLIRQEKMLRAKIPQSQPSPVPTEQPSQESHVAEIVADPFLGQTGTAEIHSRQESSDSGLGIESGMGTNYSLPRTPEDFLSNTEDMDTADPGQQKMSDFNNMEIVSMGENIETQNMDGDELVPSLQEDISSELLSDVDSVLTWL